MTTFHRALLAGILLGNAVAFAGIDPVSRLITAVAVAVLVWDLRRLPELPRSVKVAAWIFVGLSVAQLAPLPAGLRRVIEPGFADVIPSGWAPISLAPWATVQVVASARTALGGFPNHALKARENELASE